MRIYSADDLVTLFGAHGFTADAQCGSAISFARDLNADYRDRIDGTPPEILDLYDVWVDGDRAELTFEVLNVGCVAPVDRRGPDLISLSLTALVASCSPLPLWT